MARILAIGIATLDIVNHVARYPAEDSEVRAHAQRITRGGNATNTLVVLSQLGHVCSWAGVLAEDNAAAPILADLHAYHIDLRYCQRVAGRNPTSYILLSEATGSRSIVHYRDLQEYTAEAFAEIDLTAFDWVHFEGRNVEATARMLGHLRRAAPQLPCSLEIEKPRPGIEQLFGYPDLLLFARGYAEHCGHTSAAALLSDLHSQAGQAELICSWGAAGAWALQRDGELVESPAFAPARLVDTLGAGDTFNAAVIDARLRGASLAASVAAGCRMAGRKCGQWGFAGLGDAHG